MRNSFVSWLSTAVIVVGLPSLSLNTANAQSVMRTCASEWKQAEAAGTTQGQTWPQFLSQCRTRQDSAAATVAPAPAPQSGSLFPWSQPSAPTSTPASNAGAPSSGQSAMRLCASQWKDAKAAGTTGGQTWPQFLSQCRARQTSTASSGFAPASAPAPAPASQSGSLFPWWQQSTSASTPASNASAPPALQAGQYTTELAARARCPSDTVIWVNTPTRIYHYSGTRYYGQTRRGAYMCEADARAAGYRASKNRQREAEAH